MTAKELLQPRFEVIAPIPLLERYGLELGAVIELNCFNEENNQYYCERYNDLGKSKFYDEHYRSYPKRFREMNWWEGRTAEQMPKKVQFEDGEIVEIDSWDMQLLKGSFKSHPNCYIKLNHFGKDNVLTPID